MIKVTIAAPTYFRLRPEYRRSVIPFINRIFSVNGDIINLNFRKTQDISIGAFMTLIAQVEKAVSMRRRKYSIIDKFKYRKTRQFFVDAYGESTQIIFTHQLANPKDIQKNKMIDPNIITDLLKDLKKIGIPNDVGLFYNFLSELIGNATEHGVRNKGINWWVHNYKDKSSENKPCIKYVFVDMGIGIIGSHKVAKVPFKYYLLPNKRILIDAMSGVLPSSTKEENRGNGLRFIKEIVEKGYITDFRLITNNVSLHYKNGKFHYYRNQNFIGTYFSWSVTKENYLKWKDKTS